MFEAFMTQDGQHTYIDTKMVFRVNGEGPFTRPIETSDDEYSHMLNNAAA